MKQYETRCYLCDKLICRSDKQVKVICESCIDVLEKQEREMVTKYSLERKKLKNSKHFKHASELPNYGILG